MFLQDSLRGNSVPLSQCIEYALLDHLYPSRLYKEQIQIKILFL